MDPIDPSYLDVNGDFSANLVTVLDEWVVPSISGDLVIYKPGVHIPLDQSGTVYDASMALVNSYKVVKCIYKFFSDRAHYIDMQFDASFTMFGYSKQYIGLAPVDPVTDGSFLPVAGADHTVCVLAKSLEESERYIANHQFHSIGNNGNPYVFTPAEISQKVITAGWYWNPFSANDAHQYWLIDIPNKRFNFPFGIQIFLKLEKKPLPLYA